MVKVWAQPLRRQLFIAILLLLVPVLGAAVWSARATYRERSDELAEQTQTLALRSAAAIDRELTGLDRMARNLSTNPEFQRLDSASAEPLLRPQRLQRPMLIEIVLVDTKGALVARGGGSSEVDDAWDALVAPVVSGGQRVVSKMQRTVSGQHYITVAYPIRDRAGAIVGVLGCFVNPQDMEEVLGQQLLPQRSAVVVAEADGRILARNLEPERFIGQTMSGSPREIGRVRAPEVRTGNDGVERMYAEAMVPGGPWITAVGIPISVAYDRAVSLWTRSFTIFGLGLGGWLLVAVVLSRRLTQSLGHLDASAQRIASGDFTPIELRPMATREFAELQEAFNRMLTRFNETRGALDAQMAEERRIREELQLLQRQVIRQERLAAVGQLVSGVAHEINNPLQAILGFAELLQMQPEVPESVKGDLSLIQKESARACGIIRNLALFARQQTGDAGPVRFTDVIHSVVELRQRRLESEDIELRVDDQSKQPVLAVLAELQQVILNFVVNAEQAIVMSGRQPGRITLRTRDDGNRVLFEVEDTGPGVPPELEARLFQPFFTTKPVGQGTGLGLSVSYGIIDSLGGKIGYRSAPAGGGIFYVDLPAAAAA
ncbi:MAG: HAMP domain-containing protein [Acidimicrobiia bacterium]|nr:HAMP domain-containing protein [Acidimicrobiia bacterium]